MKPLIAILCLTCASAAWAVPPETAQEVAQLLDYISGSGCEFERNGSRYTAAEARAHIERKYEVTRRYVDTGEDFIQYSATQSSFSGRPYRVRCGDVEENTGMWLNRALEQLRRAP